MHHKEWIISSPPPPAFYIFYKKKLNRRSFFNADISNVACYNYKSGINILILQLFSANELSELLYIRYFTCKQDLVKWV
jgi:hypothetical protein